MEQEKDIDIFEQAFLEVIKSNSETIDFNKNYFPDFVTVENYGAVHFSKDVKLKIQALSNKLHKNVDSKERTIEIKEYLKIIRQSIAELYVETLKIQDQLDFKLLLNSFKEKIDKAIDNLKIEITHHFSCTTVGFEQGSDFKIGAVTFATKKTWIEASEFQLEKKCKYSQDEIRSFLLQPSDENFQKLDFYLQAISSKFEATKTIASISITGREFNLSKKIATITAKSSLDAISLALGQPMFFLQNRLTENSIPKGMISSVSTRNGLTFFSGSATTKNIPIHPPKIIKEFLSKNEDLINALNFIITDFSMDKKGKYPKLSHRWISALDWFAEGCREENDSIALAKISIALDVLAASGKSSGTLDVISNLLGISKTDIVDKDKNLTLEDLFSSFYKDGRSKIVHGEVADRFQTFEDLKNRIFYFARSVLINAALALHAYEGEDKKDAFKTMKPAS